jgi:signal transduction histidine kinase/DNA-binding NarL/FixJ family response regulator
MDMDQRPEDFVNAARSIIRVLLIEDSKQEARFVRMLLEAQNDVDYRVTWENQLGSGIAHLEEQGVDVLVLDLNLPGSYGLNTLRQAKAHAGRIPIVVLTGVDDPEIPIQLAREGAQDFLPKRSLDGELMSRSIRYAIERVRAEEALARRNEQLTLINAIAEKVGQSLNLGQILDDALREIASLKILGQDLQKGVIFLKNPKTERLEAAATYGLSNELSCLNRPVRIGECLCGLAAQRGEIIIANAGQQDERHTIHSTRIPPHRDLCIPLKSDKGVNGVLSLWLAEEQEITEEKKSFFRAIATHICMAVENARLYEQTRYRSAELKSLNHTAQFITSFLDLDRVLELITQEVYTMLGAEAALLLLYEPDTDALVFAASSGPALDEIEGKRIPATDGITGWVLESGQPILVDNVQTHPMRKAWIDQIAGSADHSLVAVPLRFREEIVGVLAAVNGESDPFDQQSLRLLDTLSGFAAIAIENARLYRAEREQRRLLEASQSRMIQSEKLAATGRLAASLAHEINNPLQAIHNSLQMMRSFSKPTDRQEEYIHIADGQVERLMDLVRRIVDFARPTDREAQPLDVNRAIGKIFSLARKHLQHQDIVLEESLKPNLPPVEADADELEQIFLNIILNAVEAMPQGGTLSISSFVKENKYVGVSFEDTGVGIPSKDLPYIFEPFFSTKEKGTGLGLSISYMLIERNNGKITVTSEVGRGTTFSVWLPATTEDAPPT